MKTRLLNTLAALVLIATLPAPAQAQAQSARKEPVTLAVSTVTLAFLPLYIAQNLDYFSEEGLDLKVVMGSTSQSTFAMLTSGEAPVAMVTPVAGARAAAQGLPVKNCGAVMTQNPTDFVISKEVARRLKIDDPRKLAVSERIALLKGLTLAAHTPGSSPDLTLRFVLKNAGMDPERDVKILPLTEGAILAALERNRIDGFAYASPWPDMAMTQFGAVRLVSLPTGEYQPLNGMLSVSIGCNTKVLGENPALATGFIRAIWRAMHLIKTDPQKARDAARKSFMNLDQAVFNSAMDVYLKSFPADPAISREQMEFILDYNLKTGGQPINGKIETLYTNSVVERARQELKLRHPAVVDASRR